MEDYDKFVQYRLSHLRKSEEEHHKPSPASSLIRFYGRPILPPLLSWEQRVQMQCHREAAQKAAVHRKMNGDPRMAFVQTILHSVQLRKTPTLEELLQESEINAESSYSHNTSGGSVSQSNYSIGSTDRLLLSPPPERKQKDGVSLPLLTSTTQSAFFASNLTPQQSYQTGCLIDQHCSQQGSQPSFLNSVSHQSVSSGYVTYENVENTTSVSGGVDAGRESHGISSSEEAYNTGGFFLHNTSNTIAKMPDIISHPPIDGEELERSGLESSFRDDFIVEEDVCCSSIRDHLPVVKSESSHVDSAECEDNLPVTTVVDLDIDDSLDRTEGPVSSSENSHISGNPESPQILGTRCCPTAELHIQHNHTETEPAGDHVDDAEPSKEPYRLSLQALLKKSQEYRRRQRMLRNQAKNTKIQERTQEQQRERAEEHSLSDKENNEFPYKGTVTAEGKKTKERRGTLIPSVEAPPKKSWENERMIESEFFGKKANFKSENTHLTGDGNSKEMTNVEEEATLKNNKLNISQEVMTEAKQISDVSTETSPAQEPFYLTNCPTAFHQGEGKCHPLPAPKFCRSPVHCKSKGILQDGEAADGAKTSKRTGLVNTGLNEDHKVEEVNLQHQNAHIAVPSVNVMVQGDVTSVSAKSSQHIDQLESNLSGLKVLISDLESTLAQNLGNQNQTESNTQSESSLEDVKHSDQIKNEQHMQLHQSDCDYGEDDEDRSDAERDQRYKEWPRRQSFDNFKNMDEDTRPEPHIGPLVVHGKQTEAVNLSELRPVKPLATERAEEKGTWNKGLTSSYGQHGGCRKQQPPAKCIFSLAQQLQIPDVFRNVPSETTAPHNVSVHSDTSNCPVERRDETAVEGHDFTHLPSLNQSYDVDAPSGLWFLEGSGVSLGSEGHLVQEKHLTPENGGEGQGGVSKVKRRLLMHVMEETREKRTDASRGAGSAFRPNSSTPRAAVRQYEGRGSQKDKQEQLKETHAAQVRALQEEQRRQQEELLQALAARYHLLQSVSFPCSMSGSRFGDTLTFSTPSQPFSTLSERYRPLLLAAVKGFLTRRLLKTERVAQLVRTIRDTQQLLRALQQQSPGRGERCSRQDLLLQERVTLQLRAARYEVSDIFFSLSARERMQLISWDRELAQERELRRQSGHTNRPRGKSSLSAATKKSLERKRGLMIQKKAAGRHRGVVTVAGHNTGLSAKQPQEPKRGQFGANPQRVPKSTYSSRPR
ncbi:uncharacterized protein cp110 [Chaetodon auriga]|uniref:uncharacterized protein cp110 n=1 Tax=Chaetodon auriga TaxID=39042 RepID=UPI0040330D4E